MDLRGVVNTQLCYHHHHHHHHRHPHHHHHHHHHNHHHYHHHHHHKQTNNDFNYFRLCANLTMAWQLGVDLTLTSFRPYFIHPCSVTRIFYFFDICHGTFEELPCKGANILRGYWWKQENLPLELRFAAEQVKMLISCANKFRAKHKNFQFPKID